MSSDVVGMALAWGIAEITPMNSKYVPGLVLATLGADSAASLKAAQLAKRADLPLAETQVASAHYLGRVGPCPS